MGGRRVRMSGEAGQAAIGLAASVVLVLGLVTWVLAASAAGRMSVERTETTDRAGRQAVSYAENEVLRAAQQYEKAVAVLCLNSYRDVAHSHSHCLEQFGTDLSRPLDARARQALGLTSNDPEQFCANQHASAACFVWENRERLYQFHHPDGSVWFSMGGVVTRCDPDEPGWCWRTRRAAKVEFAARTDLEAQKAAIAGKTADQIAEACAKGVVVCLQVWRFDIWVAPSRCVVGERELDDGCEAAKAGSIGYQRRSFLDYQLRFERMGAPASNPAGVPTGTVWPFAHRDYFKGPVRVEDPAGSLVYCGTPEFSDPIEVGPGGAGWTLAPGCDNSVAAPTVRIVTTDAKSLAAGSFNDAREQAKAAGTYHTAGGANWVPHTDRTGASEMRLQFDLGCAYSNARADDRPLAGSVASQKERPLIVFVEGDVEIFDQDRGLCGSRQVWRGPVAVIASGDVWITGDLNKAGGSQHTVTVLASETGNIIVDVPLTVDAVEIVAVALLAPEGGFLLSNWDSACVNFCGRVNIRGSLWLKYRGVSGQHNTDGWTQTGRRVIMEYPHGVSLLEPAWWPDFSDGSWVPVS